MIASLNLASQCDADVQLHYGILLVYKVLKSTKSLGELELCQVNLP
jgi:hypothetical protein